nr:hypothetical protein [Pseudomonas izuensis]
MRSISAVILSLLPLSLSACALFPNRDPLNINVMGSSRCVDSGKLSLPEPFTGSR